MATKTLIILNILKVIFWVIFIGLCINTGTIIVSYIVSVAVNPVASQNLHIGLNLTELYKYSIVHYSLFVFVLTLLTGLKAYIGYWVIKIFLELKIEKPFSKVIKNYIIKISHIALWAGHVALIGYAYSRWLMKKDIPTTIHWAYGEILFFAGIIYFIAQIIKKGMELQTENELTI